MSTARVLGQSGVVIFNDQQPSCQVSQFFAHLLNVPESTAVVSLPVNTDKPANDSDSAMKIDWSESDCSQVSNTAKGKACATS
jgi:hypothetical protein